MSVSGDPFLVSNDSSGLRLEIKRLQTENMALKQQSAQWKLKVEQLASAQGAAPGDGVSAGNRGNSAAASKKKAAATSNQASKELEAENARLKEELARTKRDLAHVVQESEKIAQTKSQHQQLLEAVSVAACEREQRLRNAAVEIQMQLQDARRQVEELQKKCLESQAAAAVPSSPPPPAQAPAAALSAPPPPPFPIDTARSLLATLKESLSDLDACLNGALPAHRSQAAATTVKRVRGSATITAAAGHSTKGNEAAAAPADRHDSGGAAVLSSYSAHTSSTGVATVARAGAALQQQLQQQSSLSATPSVSGTRKRAAAAAHEEGDQPRQRGRRTETSQPLLPAVKAFIDATAAAAGSQPPAGTSNNNAARTSAVSSSSLASPRTQRSLVNFSQDPFHDVHTLYHAIPLLKRNVGVGKLASQVALHFERNHKALAASLVRHVAASGQQWSSAELRKRAVVFSEVMFAAGGGDLFDACIEAVRTFSQSLVATREALQTDYRPQISPVAAFLRHVLTWRKANEVQNQAALSHQHQQHLYAPIPELLLHEVLLVGLRGLRRAGGESLFCDELYLWEEVLCWCQYLNADKPNDDDDDNDAPIEARSSPDDSAGVTNRGERPSVALSLTLQALLGDVVAHHRPDLRGEFDRACDAAGWSRSLVPLTIVEQVLTKLAVRANTSSTAQSASSPRRRSGTLRGMERASSGDDEGKEAFEPLQCLRLLVLYRGLPHLSTITAAWNTALPSPPREGTGAEGAAVVSQTPGESRNVATALVVLVGFVAIDLQLVDDRDQEWTNTANLLLGDAAPSASSLHRRLLPAWAQDIACLALLHMCCPSTPNSSNAASSSPDKDLSAPQSSTTSVAKRVVLQRLAAMRKSKNSSSAAAPPLTLGFESAWAALEAEAATKTTKHQGGK